MQELGIGHRVAELDGLGDLLELVRLPGIAPLKLTEHLSELVRRHPPILAWRVAVEYPLGDGRHECQDKLVDAARGERESGAGRRDIGRLETLRAALDGSIPIRVDGVEVKLETVNADSNRTVSDSESYSEPSSGHGPRLGLRV